jgi:hypothetical protein
MAIKAVAKAQAMAEIAHLKVALNQAQAMAIKAVAKAQVMEVIAHRKAAKVVKAQAAKAQAVHLCRL